MAAIEAIHEITLWRKNLASSAYSAVIILPRPNPEEHSNSCNSRSPLGTDRNNGPQLDSKQVPQSTLPDDRESCFRSNLRKEQTAMLERLLADELVPEFAQRTTGNLINEKRESRPNLEDLSQCTEIMTVPPYHQMTPISVDGPQSHFRIHVSKTGHAMLYFGQTTCAVCAECSAVSSRNNREDQLDSARKPRTATHVHPICAPGRDPAQPTLLVCPTVLGMERVNKCMSNKSCKSNSVCSVKKTILKTETKLSMRFARKGADVTKVVAASSQLQVYWNMDLEQHRTFPER